MKIFKVDIDSNSVQSITTESNDYESYAFSTLAGMPVSKNRVFPEYYILNPRKKPKDFYSADGSSVLLFRENVLNIFKTIFDDCGEIFPIYLDDNSILYVFNATKLIECVDYKSSNYNKGGTISEYVLTESKLNGIQNFFKTPDKPYNDLFIISREDDKENDFYYIYQKYNLKGLEFIELNFR